MLNKYFGSISWGRCRGERSTEGGWRGCSPVVYSWRSLQILACSCVCCTLGPLGPGCSALERLSLLVPSLLRVGWLQSIRRRLPQLSLPSLARHTRRWDSFWNLIPTSSGKLTLLGTAGYCWELLQVSSGFALLVFSNRPLAALPGAVSHRSGHLGLEQDLCLPPQQHLEKPHPHSPSSEPGSKGLQDAAGPAWCLVRLTALQL